MSKESNQAKSADKCPCCGGSDFIEGGVGPVRATFRPQGLGMFEVGESVRARKCAACGNIQLFADEQTARPPQS